MAGSRTLPLFPAESLAGMAVPPAPGRRRPLKPPDIAARPKQLWMAIHLPHLAVEALRAAVQNDSGDPAGDVPFAAIDPTSRQHHILACNAAAAARGIRPGQSLNAALSLTSDLMTRPRDTRREQELLGRIAAGACCFTPMISLEPPDEVLLEVRGSLRLFGGIQALLTQVEAGLHAHGVTARCALAPTPSASLWLARATRQREAAVPIVESMDGLSRHLAPLPIDCLRWPDERCETLLRMGVRTIGELLRLPRSGLGRRLGVAVLDALDGGVGRKIEPRRSFRAIECYRDAFEPETEITSTQWLEALVHSRFERLQQFLRTRQAAVTALRLELRHRQHAPTRVRIALALPCAEIGHLKGLLHEQLAALKLPAPVIAVRLRSAPLLAYRGSSNELPLRDFLSAPPSRGDALARTIERLRARLGQDAVFGVRLVEDHRPERAWAKSSLTSKQSMPSGFVDRPRPAWLLQEPQPLTTTRAGLMRGDDRLSLDAGPECIETGWWDEDAARDYFVARDSRSAKLWIYRERRPPHRWYVHGLFG